MAHTAYPQSYYAASANPVPQRPTLQGEVETDVCIIGAGYTGLSTALFLLENGFKVSIVEAAKDVFGVPLPGTRETAFAGSTGALWMSPDEALLLCPYDAAQTKADDLAAKLADTHALVVNVSDARAVFQLKGRMLREVIAKLAPVDMSPEAFKPGMVRRTRMIFCV